MPKEYTLIGGNGTVVSPLEVTEDGDYIAGDSRAFNPVKVRTGGGGSSTLSGLTDVDLTNPSDGQMLVYDATAQKWVNGSGGGGNLVVHVAVNNGTYTADKTAAEIYPYAETGNVLWIIPMDDLPEGTSAFVVLPCVACGYMSGETDMYQFVLVQYDAGPGTFNQIELSAVGGNAYPSYTIPG